MAKEFDVLVFIGRFSPLHLGHEMVIRTALEKADEVVLLIGSAHEARSIRNPWTFDERCEMIFKAFPNTNNLTVAPLPDFPYDDSKWLAAARSSVMACAKEGDRIGLIGHEKDHTSYYLKLFPDWGNVSIKNYEGLNATDVRVDYFTNQQPEPHGYPAPTPIWPTMVSSNIKKWIDDNPLPKTLIADYFLIEKYKAAWESAPYPPIFHTTDAVIVQSGHILLVKRKSSPGMGQWALPGGFLNVNERLEDGMLRELREETKIKVPEPVLRGSIKGRHVFDAPNRSTRGRTITTAFFIDLGFDKKLPKVTGADDAEKAVWVPLNELDRNVMFEDHFHIIDHFVGVA